MIDEKIPEQIVFTNEKATEELKMPEAENKLCFISAPFQRLSFLKELLYPVLKENGISPISLDEAIMPGEILTRKIDTLISKSSMAVVDLSGNNANVMWELGNVMSKTKKAILIVDNDQSGNLPSNLSGLYFLKYSLSDDNSDFINSLNKCLKELNGDTKDTFNPEEYFRLLDKGEYNASVIAAFRFLETTLSDKYNTFNTTPLLNTLSLLNTNNDKDKELLRKVKEYRKVRNNIVHTNANVSKEDATDIIKSIDELCKSIRNGNIIIL